MENKCRIEGEKTFVKCVNSDIEFIIDTSDLGLVASFAKWDAFTNDDLTSIYCANIQLRRYLIGASGRSQVAININGNRFDCRRKNLKLGTQGEALRQAKMLNEAYEMNEMF